MGIQLLFVQLQCIYAVLSTRLERVYKYKGKAITWVHSKKFQIYTFPDVNNNVQVLKESYINESLTK